MPLLILFVARLLANEHQLRGGRPGTKHRLRGVLVEITCATVLTRTLQLHVIRIRRNKRQRRRFFSSAYTRHDSQPPQQTQGQSTIGFGENSRVLVPTPS
jgi:hypothetical protein